MHCRLKPKIDGRTSFRIALAILSLFAAQNANAQPAPMIRRAAPAVATPPKPADTDDDPATALAEQQFPGGAALKTDPEQQRLLKRAEQCVEDGRLDLAAVLWQKVLDEAGDTLMTRDGRTYRSLAEQVEQTLARLPKLALDTYRTSADAEAQALIAAGGSEGEEAALSQVVRRFFLSSLGDDAAYKLACLALDRHDFVGASRLLNKILESHPDPSISKADIVLRLAVASAHMQDRQAADRSLGQLATTTGPRPPTDVVDLIVADVKSAAASSLAGDGDAKDWHMLLGSANRSGHMASLPAAVTSRTLSELWVREFSLGMATQPGGSAQVMMGGFGGGIVMAGSGRALPGNRTAAPVSREELIAQWRAGGWRPTGRLLFDRDRVYMKTPDRLICYRAAAVSDQPLWQSAWENRYQLDGMSQQLAMLSMSMGVQLSQPMQAKPKTPAEVLLFGDRVHQSAAIDAGVIYTLEGKRVTPGETPANAAAGARPFQWGAGARRSRSNWLTAYQAAGGKALWTRTASDDDAEGLADVGFLSAPVPAGSLLLAPVTDGGTIWLVALDRASGKTVWRSYLCDEPQGGASPWAETVLAVDGRDAYLTCGCGVVFAIDAASGSIRWAVRYQRDGKPNQMQQRMYGGNYNLMLDLNGWDDDVAIPSGRALIVMSSDSDKLLALDRRTGELLWESPRTSPLGSVASYCLGALGRGLFVAGKNVVRRYDIVSGRLIWEKEFEDSFGRGCVTEGALYLPVRDSILKLDPERGRDLAQVGVALTSDEPVGNLFSDGEKLWVVGAGRVYAMTTLEHRLEMLAEQIAAGDAEAQLNRMRLYFKQNRTELALADLRGAYARFQQQLSPDEAALRLFAAMHDLKLPQTQPLVTLRLLSEQFVTDSSPPKLSRDAATRRADVIATSVNMIRQQKTAAGVGAVLATAPLLTEDYLLQAATHAVDAAATKDDVANLIEALEKGPAEAQLIAMRAASRLAPEEAKSPLAKLLPAASDRVRLAAVKALANLEERKDVLETLVRLLESPNAKIRARSYQSLSMLTGQKIPFLPEAKAEDRTTGVRAWQRWVEESGADSKWTLPLADQMVPLGRILFVSSSQATVMEMDADHKQRWQARIPGPAWGCQGLPNGHRLVAVYAASMVIEYDADGKEIWRKDRLPGPPFSVQRLDNGNTLVACSTSKLLVEIAPDGTTTTISLEGNPISAQRLDNGNTLVALQQANSVAEVDRSGRIVSSIRTPSPPAHAVRLENGNTLVTLPNQRQVVEYDSTGTNQVWRTQVPLSNPFAAQRLPSGSTLVADHTGVREIDAAGTNVTWQHRQQQVTGLSSF